MTAWVLRTVAITAGTAGAVFLLALVAARAVRARPALHSLFRKERWSLALCLAAIALRANVADVPAKHLGRDVAIGGTDVAVIGLSAWVALRALLVLEASLTGRFDVTRRDNRHARTRRTQIHLLRRVASVIVVVLAVIAALRSFTWGRDIGTSLLAAGGILGLVIGVSGRSTIGNLIAGMQIAATEPIRLDDVVVVEGEWGNVEEITLTHVIVQIWDERRLVLPTSYFVETPFQNWTRRSADILGTVELWVDYETDVPALRAQLHEIVERSAHWDGRVVVLHVTNATPHAMLARALVSAADAPTLWELRCEVRESLAAWLAEAGTGSVPRLRVSQDNPVPTHSGR
jgi:small-conductance mechanosensitive channel